MDRHETRGPAGAGLDEVKRRFDRWRRRGERPGRIPNELWRKAAEAAVVHGVEATTQTLRLPAARLKQWMGVVRREASLPVRVRTQTGPAPAAPQFFELSPLAVASGAECTLELEDKSGRKLRIVLKGQATAQTAALGRMLWRDEA